ncbi:hypothetical protein NPIL_236021, partial [Nephila pilipes]
AAPAKADIATAARHTPGIFADIRLGNSKNALNFPLPTKIAVIEEYIVKEERKHVGDTSISTNSVLQENHSEVHVKTVSYQAEATHLGDRSRNVSSDPNSFYAVFIGDKTCV